MSNNNYLTLPILVLKLKVIKFCGCVICLVSGIATKAAVPSPKIIYDIPVEAHQAKLFSNKMFSMNLVL